MTNQLTEENKTTIVEALKDYHYKKRSAYKKTGMPETLEELEQCKVALQELTDIETMQQTIAIGTVTIEIPDATEDVIAEDVETTETIS